jgi:hypothetical protein
LLAAFSETSGTSVIPTAVPQEPQNFFGLISAQQVSQYMIIAPSSMLILFLYS